MADQLRYPVTDEERDALLVDARTTRAAQAGADPLRALLADERRALETLTRAWWDGEFGAGSWDRDVARATQARQIEAMRPVLAALREVAR